MAMLYYLDTDNEITRFFKTHLREAEVLRNNPSFALQYCALARFHQMLMPFCWLKTGDRAIQVGCTEWMIDFGVSMALIMAAIVGPEGEVLVIEPDPRNINTFSDYLSRNGVANVRIVKAAAWKESGEMDFTFYEDRTSSNVLTNVQNRADWRSDDEYRGRPVRAERINVDTIDAIARREGFEPDFVNVTINDAEYEALQGMTGLLDAGVKVAWLFGGDRTWWRESFEIVSERGYEVYVSNAPYTHRGPAADGKVQFYDYEMVPQELYAVAVRGEQPPAGYNPVRIVLDKKSGSRDFEWREIKR